MSRSCQSGTFSKPTTALPRITRARPLMRSQVIGLRLCGIAEEPFCPRANGSAASRTSLRCRWRISVAKRSSELPRIASDASSSACRSRATTCVATSSRPGRARRARDPRRAGRRCRRPRRRPTACRRRRRERALDALAVAASSYHQPSSLSPNVVGSACTPWVRPMQGVSRCSSARARTASSARSSPPSSTSRRPSRSCSASAVSTTSDDVSP